MKVFILYLLYGAISLALQTTWLGNFPARMIRLDMIFMAAMALSLSEERKRIAIPLLLALGALTDLSSGAPFGLSPFSYLIVYACMRGLSSQITLQTSFAQFVWCSMMSLIDKFACAVLLASWSRSAEPFLLWIPWSIPQAAVDATLGFIMVPFLQWYAAITKETFSPRKGLRIE